MAIGAGEETRRRIVLVPFPAQGHVTPMLNLARGLHALGFEPVLAVPDFIHSRLVPRLRPGDDRVAFEPIPSGLGGDEEDRLAGPSEFAAIDGAMESCMPAHLEKLLVKGGHEVCCVVVDLVASWAIGVAERCGVRVAGFWPAMLATYQLMWATPDLIRNGFISEDGTPLHQTPALDRHGHDDDQDPIVTTDKLRLPAQAKLTTKDLPWLVGSPASQKYRFKFWLRILSRASSLPWLLVNSFPGESGAPDPPPDQHGPTIFQVGPLLANDSPSMWDEDSTCLQWLDHHPPGSVVYVSFGSWVNPVGPDMIAELAAGLEVANRPFLWVLKDEHAWRAGLPAGFSERVAGRGKVVAWAPQEAVLGHVAVACYITHCGWNSTVEGIRHGKRLVCYPMAGDQFVNCRYIVRVWGIGIKPSGFGRDAVMEGIQRVTEGEEGREIEARVVEMKERVMGGEGRARVEANLQLFVLEITHKTGQ